MKRNVYLHTNPHSVYIGTLRAIQPVGGVSVCVCRYRNKVFMGGRNRGIPGWIMGHHEHLTQLICQCQTFHSLN